MNPKHLERIISLRHTLHRRPELSLKEEGTVRILEAFLRDSTSLEILDQGGWFCAVFRGNPELPAVAFRADMDALPIPETVPLPYGSERDGVSHKCGHDGHCAALCGLALEIEEHPPERPVFLIFQPAEEIGAGGAACAQRIRDFGIREVYAFHNLSGYPEGRIVYRKGLTQPASEGLTLSFAGKRSHASAPEEGRNPAGVIAGTVLHAQKLLEGKQNGMVLCTVTGMSAGTGDFGISAGEGSLMLTLRAEREQEMLELETELIRYAGRRAEEEGIRMETAVTDRFPETRNHASALEKVLACAGRAGLQTEEMRAMWRASEDFGHYLRRIPGAMIYIGNGEGYPPLHTPEYDFNDRILEPAVDLFRTIAEDADPVFPDGREADGAERTD